MPNPILKQAVVIGDGVAGLAAAKAQPTIALEIEAIAPSNSSAAPDVNNRSERCPTPETAGRMITRWLVEAVLRAGAAGATLCGGPTTFPPLNSPPEGDANSQNLNDRSASILAGERADRAPKGSARW
jgi:hypothetical protein